VSQPASPSAYSGYSGLYLPDSPLLSQSSDALHFNSFLQDNVRYNSTPNIAETVRYSSSTLGHEDQQSRYQEQSFGHTINLANHQQQQSYYQATTNFQIQQWPEESLTSVDEDKVKNILENVAPTERLKELFDDEVDIDDEYTGDDAGSAKCKWGECSEEFSDMKQLVDHINNVHIQVRRGTEEYPCFWKNCPRQSKPFNAKYKLVTHIRVHTGERPFKCNQKGCGRSFARLENLKIHNRSHTGEKPFLCKFFKICQKAFSNSSDRAKHEQTHKDPKPYKCEVVGCYKRYTDPSSLRKHVKNHSKEDQEQARMIKESSKERERRRSYPDLGLVPGDHLSCWSAATSYSDISAANTGATDNTSVNSSSNLSCLMSGGGLLTTCEARDAAWQRQVQDTCEGGATWQRKLETDHLYYTTTTPIF